MKHIIVFGTSKCFRHTGVTYGIPEIPTHAKTKPFKESYSGPMAYSSSKMPTKATQKSKQYTEKHIAAPVQLSIKQLKSKYHALKFHHSYQGHLRITGTTAYGSSCPTEKEILHFAIRTQPPKLKRFVHLKPLSF